MVKLGNGKSERLFELKSVVARPPFFRSDKAGLLRPPRASIRVAFGSPDFIYSGGDRKVKSVLIGAN